MMLKNDLASTWQMPGRTAYCPKEVVKGFWIRGCTVRSVSHPLLWLEPHVRKAAIRTGVPSV